MKLSTFFFRSLIILAFIISVLLYSAGWLVKSAINQSIADKGITFDIQSLQLNLFNLSFSSENIVLAKKDNSVFAIESLQFDIAFWPLFSKELQIQALHLKGLQLNAQFINEQLHVEGFEKEQQSTQVANNTDKAPPSDAEDKPEQKAHESAWQVKLDEFSLNNSQITLNAEQIHHLKINKLSIQDSFFSKIEKQLHFTLAAKLNDQAMSVAGKLHNQAQLTQITLNNTQIKLQLSDYQQWLPEEYKQATSQFTLNFDSDIVVNQKGLLASSKAMQLSLKNTRIPTPMVTTNSQLTLADLTLDLSNIEFKKPQNSLPTAKADFALKLNKFSLDDTKQNAHISQFQHFSLPQGQLTFNKALKVNAYTVILDQLTLMQLSQLENIALAADSPIQPLVELNQLTLKNLNYDQQGISLASIIADTQSVTVYRSQHKAIENWLALASASTAAPAENTTKTSMRESANPTPFSVKVDHFSLIGEPTFTLQDFSTTPSVYQAININVLTLDNLSSLPADSKAQFVLKGDMGKRSSIDMSGDIAPFNDNKDMQVKGAIKGMNLTPYSPYISQALGYDIEKGLLFADINFNVKEQVIQGQVETTIKALTLSDSQQLTQSETAPGMVPLNLAISQLTNEQGNLEITIPLAGNVNDPNFGLSGLVQLITTKALTEGAKTYLLQTFVPYASVVNLAMLAGDTLFKVSINDLNYDTGQTKLTAPQLKFAKELGLLMQEKQQGQLTVCPTVVYQVEQKSQQKELEALGQTRIDLFIDYLISAYQIDSERLIPCKTKLLAADMENAQAKITFEIQ